MAYTTINKGSLYMNPVLYTGNGGTQSITGAGFQPDWTWIKRRDADSWHQVNDSVRGAGKVIHTNVTNAEGTQTNNLTSFDTDGFSVGNGDVNNSSAPFVSWNWKAGGTASSNTAGSITSSVSANTTAGFSVVTYTGNGTSGSTIGHGLTSVPSMIIVKRRNATNGWAVYHKTLGTGSEVYLNLTQAVTSSNFWITTPTTSVFSVSSSDYVNTSSDTYVAYCFAEKKGFSKFGSYVGTGSSTGTPFIYTGFKPAFVMTKISSGTSDDWTMTDIVRDNAVGGGNGTGARLQANYSGAEAVNTTYASIQKYSNGFSPQGNLNVTNGSGYTYIYMAFAEHPFVGSDGTPVTAR